ncbi:MAG: HNH endonuclease [Dehalococcoidaceae bacterium]|nr:HNH endonuclease [Dehalococcoidaceae bacterium]
MRAYLGVTDNDWFNYLSSLPELAEVNFWQPHGSHTFKALDPGELFLFKLHSPDNYIVGGGIFWYSSILPVTLAWESFGQANGARDYWEMRKLIVRARHEPVQANVDFNIGCIMLEQPFFLPREKWIPVPSDFKPNIVQGKRYDLTVEPGLSIWRQLQGAEQLTCTVCEEAARYGEPVITFPRLGQGTFRILVTDAYERRCAMTNERTLPALDAAHIKPYSESGGHTINNGILMRRDLHALFDRGYITINPALEIEVSRRIKEEYENGRDYYRLHGNKIHVPAKAVYQPSRDYIEWHNSKVYLG